MIYCRIWHCRPSKKTAEYSSFKGYDDSGSFEKRKFWRTSTTDISEENFSTFYSHHRFIYVVVNIPHNFHFDNSIANKNIIRRYNFRLRFVRTSEGKDVEKVSIVSPRKRTIKLHICCLWLVSSLWKEFHALEDDVSISIVFAFPSSTFLTYRWVVRHHQLSPRCNDKLNQAWTES